MSQAIDITAEQRETVHSLLAKHLPNTEAWVYGSRVRWTSRPESDLDMAVFATPEQRRAVSDLREAFEESNLAFRVDLFVWDEVPAAYREQIEREHVVLHPSKGTASAQCLGQDGWVHLSLGRVCTKIGSGATPRGGKAVYLKHGEYALIRSQNVLNDGFRDEGLAYIGRMHALQLKNVEVLEGDVLLNITGDSVARVCQVRSDVLPARVNQHVAIIRPHPEKLDPRFLRYALVSPKMQTELLSWAGSGATRNALTKGMIESLDVAAPQDVGEQSVIAQILGALDDKIDLNRRINETLEAMARALFKSWFVDFEPVRAKMAGRPTGLRQSISTHFPSGMVQAEARDVPGGWCTGTLAEVAMARRHNVTPADCGDQTPYIALEHMPRRSIALGSWGSAGSVKSAKSRFGKGDILFGKLRPYFHKAGIAPVDGVCSTDIVVIVPRSPEWSAFVSATVSSDHFVTYTDQTSAGTRMPRTSWKTMSQYAICMPPNELVSAYQEAAQPLLDKILVGIHSNKSLASLRDALLPKLLSGELRVQDAERIAAAVI